MLSICLGRWYINITITIPDTVNRPVFNLKKHDVSETRLCLRLRKEPTPMDPTEWVPREEGDRIQSPKRRVLNKKLMCGWTIPRYRSRARVSATAVLSWTMVLQVSSCDWNILWQVHVAGCWKEREREDAGRCLNKTLGGANHYPYTTAPRS
jgi:hypothetical protein